MFTDALIFYWVYASWYSIWNFEHTPECCYSNAPILVLWTKADAKLSLVAILADNVYKIHETYN